MTGVPIVEIAADQHYKKNDYNGNAKILIHGTSNTGLRPCEKRRKKRRSSVEPIISHLKAGHRLCRNRIQYGKNTTQTLNNILSFA
ncbi:MAG: hypothetical protein LBJ00_08005 [Planctomycetaceae bacterium]|nr:hypothetical protein [Planctomycetaceae bacterium]